MASALQPASVTVSSTCQLIDAKSSGVYHNLPSTSVRLILAQDNVGLSTRASLLQRDKDGRHSRIAHPNPRHEVHTHPLLLLSIPSRPEYAVLTFFLALLFFCRTGVVLHSTAQLPEADQAPLLKSGPIRCAAVDRELKYLLTSGDDKILKLWSLENLKLINERCAFTFKS